MNERLTCPDCDEEMWGDTPEDRQRYWELHQGTVGHKASLLGEAGKELMRTLGEARDDWLRKHGFIP